MTTESNNKRVLFYAIKGTLEGTVAVTPFDDFSKYIMTEELNNSDLLDDIYYLLPDNDEYVVEYHSKFYAPDEVDVWYTILNKENYKKQNKQQGLEFVKEYYGFPFECNKCGYTSELFAPFDLHHRNPDDKEGTPSQLFKQSFDRFKKEVEKCDLVCANCHRIEHYNKKQGDNYEN